MTLNQINSLNLMTHINSILVVDDDLMNLEAMKVVLQSALKRPVDDIVRTATGGDQAVQMIKGGLEPQIIFMDINMPPGIDGYETTR